MSKDMTSGKPLRLIISFCIPLMLGTLFQQFYSMVDAIVVGKFVGVNALAGVGSTGAVNFLILGFANGVCSGFSIMYGQRFGARDYSGMRSFISAGNEPKSSLLDLGDCREGQILRCLQRGI